MMREAPSYENVYVAAGESAVNINLGFDPDEDLTKKRKQSTPIIRTNSLHAHQTIPSFPPLTTKEMKRACHFYVAEKCCYGSTFIENMTVIEVSDRIAYHYILESYGEKRESAEQIKPYYGGDVDGVECGPTIRPWDIQVTPSNNFKNDKKTVEIPHTSYLKMCTKCNGKGNTNCKFCLGIGGRGCILCIPNKRNRPCTNCKYSGHRCMFCNGEGTEKCRTCDGRGKLRVCKILIVSWVNHKDHFITDTMTLPLEEIKNAKGKQIVVFTEESEELSPAWNVPSTSVMAASTELINKHKAGFDNEVIRRQRHTVYAVPFTHVKYRWREDIGEFYVYGVRKQVYFENYPQQCCCCCLIM